MTDKPEGTILGREVRAVVIDLMIARGVPSAVWSMSPRGMLRILIGDRAVEIACPRRQNSYTMTSLLERINRILDEREIAVKHRGQMDLEQAIAAQKARASEQAA